MQVEEARPGVCVSIRYRGPDAQDIFNLKAIIDGPSKEYPECVIVKFLPGQGKRRSTVIHPTWLETISVLDVVAEV